MSSLTDQPPRTRAGRRILQQDYRGNETYSVTRADILGIEAEAADHAVSEAALEAIRQHRQSITRHDIQTLRRKVLLDCRAVGDGQIDAFEVIKGVIEELGALLDKSKS